MMLFTDLQLAEQIDHLRYRLGLELAPGVRAELETMEIYLVTEALRRQLEPGRPST